MPSYDPGNSRQIIAALTGDLTRNSRNNRCPKCEGRYANRRRHRFGIVFDTHDYYGTIYRCSCQAVLWVISPETGDRIEEVK